MNREKLSDERTAALCSSLALLLHAGLPLADGVFLLAREDAESEKLLTGLGKRLDSGASLSEAMEESGVFADYVTGMARVGERTGRLEESLKGLAEYYAERCRIAGQLRSAVAYPGMLLLLMLAVIGVLLIRVLPVFDRVYASLGGRLTGVAGGLLRAGQLLEGMLPMLLVLLAAVVAAVGLIGCVSSLREACAAFGNRHFGDRGIHAKFNNARFARAMAMGLSSGLALQESVELARMLLSDIPGAAKRCGICGARLAEGASLSDAMGAAALLSGSACRMLAVGLRGGNGDQVMDEIARRMMEEAEAALERSISRVEPAMVMASSLLVGVILLSVMLPLMNILSSIG